MPDQVFDSKRTPEVFRQSGLYTGRYPPRHSNGRTAKTILPINGFPKPAGSQQLQIHTYSAYWKLDEASGTRADLQGLRDLQSSNPLANPGIIGQAAQFVSASNDQLVTFGAADPLPYLGDWTLSMWIYPDQIGIVQLIAAVGETVAPNVIWWLRQSGGGTPVMQVSPDGTPAAVLTWPFPFTVSTWHHLIFRHRNGVQIDGFLNGTPSMVTPYTLGLNPTPVNNDFYLGAAGGVIPSTFDGRIDEVGFWSSYLSDADCLALYNGGVGRTPPF